MFSNIQDEQTVSFMSQSVNPKFFHVLHYFRYFWAKALGSPLENHFNNFIIIPLDHYYLLLFPPVGNLSSSAEKLLRKYSATWIPALSDMMQPSVRCTLCSSKSQVETTRWQPRSGWDASQRCAIGTPVQFGTGCRSRNLAPSLHLSHSNYNLLKSCYPTPRSDNDSASS